MSYMNDDCDPFGVPYNTPSHIEEEYSLQDLRELYEEERELRTKLNTIGVRKEKAINHLKNRINEIMKTHFKCIVEINECECFITVDDLYLSDIEELKKIYDLEDIRIEVADDKIRIRLFW